MYIHISLIISIIDVVVMIHHQSTSCIHHRHHDLPSYIIHRQSTSCIHPRHHYLPSIQHHINHPHHRNDPSPINIHHFAILSIVFKRWSCPAVSKWPRAPWQAEKSRRKLGRTPSAWLDPSPSTLVFAKSIPKD